MSEFTTVGRENEIPAIHNEIVHSSNYESMSMEELFEKQHYFNELFSRNDINNRQVDEIRQTLSYLDFEINWRMSRAGRVLLSSVD